MEQKEKKLIFLKNLLYFALLIFFFVIGEIPNLNFLWAKAIPVLPVVICIAMFEGDAKGAVFGFIAGLCLDTYASYVFGISCAVFAILGFAAGFLVTFLLQNNIRTAFILSLAASCIHGIITFYVIYGMWDIEGKALLFWERTVPSMLVTSLFAFPAYYIVGKIKERMNI